MSDPNPKCPYCGHVYHDFFDYSDLTWDGMTACAELDCPQCGKEYRVDAEADFVFSCTTSKLKE